MNRSMTIDARLERQLQALFREKLHVEVPSAETDLLDTGLLDSLLIVDLLLHLERELECSFSLEELELDDFRTLTTIARCVEQKGSAGNRLKS